ncbi:MAG: pyridoxamine 5'-phosphate oxidase family protein [Candidatus Hodarchaeales archaeon]
MVAEWSGSLRKFLTTPKNFFLRIIYKELNRLTQYHLRRSEKAITEKTELVEIIHSQKFMTLALSRKNEPYLVTVNYAYNDDEKCFYFHCAMEGKKIDYLKDNPMVWGQILDDRGYLEGECDHAFRCVHFKGHVEFLTTDEEKRAALYRLIEQQEQNPELRKDQLDKTESLTTVGVVRVHIKAMTGKKSPISSS